MARSLEDELVAMRGELASLNRRMQATESRVFEQNSADEQLGVARRIVINGETYYIGADGVAVLSKVVAVKRKWDGLAVTSPSIGVVRLAFEDADKTFKIGQSVSLINTMYAAVENLENGIYYVKAVSATYLDITDNNAFGWDVNINIPSATGNISEYSPVDPVYAEWVSGLSQDLYGAVSCAFSIQAESITTLSLHGTYNYLKPIPDPATYTATDVNIQFTCVNSGTVSIETVQQIELNSEGLKFPSSSSKSIDPNTFDDYQEGEFVAELYTTGGGGGTVSLDTDFDTLKYVKIGSAVFVSGKLRVSDDTAFYGNMFLKTLPFPCKNTSVLYGRLSDTMGFTGTVFGLIEPEATAVGLEYDSSGSIAAIDTGAMYSGTIISFSFSYLAD